MNRRGFLAGLLSFGVLAGAGVRLPEPKLIEVEADPYLIDRYAWRVRTDFSNTVKGVPLTQESLEKLLVQMREMTDSAGKQLRLMPTKIIVHPDMLAQAQRIIAYRPTLFDRLWWWLTDAAA